MNKAGPQSQSNGGNNPDVIGIIYKALKHIYSVNFKVPPQRKVGIILISHKRELEGQRSETAHWR